MITDTKIIPHNSLILFTIGDLHSGDDAYGRKSRSAINAIIDFVRDTENAYLFFNGDIFNAATRASKTSPFTSKTIEEELGYLKGLFWEVRHKVVGMVDGNHCKRITDFAGFSPLLLLSSDLGIPYYKTTAVIKFKVGDNKEPYVCVFQHTTGGGKLLGSKVNRVEEMRRSTVVNADAYFGSHNHQQGVLPVCIRYFDGHKVVEKKQMLVDCGGFLEWDNSYAEGMQLAPLVIGAPVIEFSGKRRNIRGSVEI